MFIIKGTNGKREGEETGHKWSGPDNWGPETTTWGIRILIGLLNFDYDYVTLSIKYSLSIKEYST